VYVFQSSIRQASPFKVHIASSRLETTSYQIHVDDNLVSDGDPTPEDRIRLGCSSFLSEPTCNPQQIPGSDIVDWAFSVTLNDDGETFDGADIPADLAVWRDLIPGSLLVTFRDTVSGRGTGFAASIESFEIVPEPMTIVLIIAVFCGAMVARTAHRHLAR
jgi:hypothetical protein